jgi:hypothetical protein
MVVVGTERTPPAILEFKLQTPSESKKPCFPFRVWFYHFSNTPLSQPLLDHNGNQLGSILLVTLANRDIFRYF